MFEYQDALQRLNENLPLTSKFVDIHDILRPRHPFIDRFFAMLNKLTGVQLDADCVAALIDKPEEIELIQRQFGKIPTGDQPVRGPRRPLHPLFAPASDRPC